MPYKNHTDLLIGKGHDGGIAAMHESCRDHDAQEMASLNKAMFSGKLSKDSTRITVSAQVAFST